ncbi:glycosyltransferase family protein [Azospirillum canadense]|uniref:glycosyltransferase family protein n=1 Tax=Azospirillum canadense TaxID=403962 RepID=UPI002225BAAD|nr:glycosyltransferase family protein [Azospirillum canadense]MCW2243734.1 spore coat polysaccharide biosynthesis protein SpsF [Azospirillum canadense]
MTAKKPPEKRRVVCISQARMTSTRLPGKVLMNAAGKPLLAHHLGRLSRCRRLDALVLATTVNATDDPVADLAGTLGVPVFRGSEHDVLSRFAGAAAMAGADVVVRVTADCPLIDPALVDRVVTALLESDPPLDYVSLDVTRYPRGLDTEVFTRAALDEAAANATDPAEREHVTAHIYRRPDRFRLGAPLQPDGDAVDQRWCVDEQSDLDLVRTLLGALLPEKPDFGWQDCCKLLDQHPDWADINRAVRQRTLH